MRQVQSYRTSSRAIYLQMVVAAALVLTGLSGLVFAQLAALSWLSLIGLALLSGTYLIWLTRNRQRFDFLREVERQLEQCAQAQDEPGAVLETIDGQSSVAFGWNRMVKEAVYSGLLKRLETSISSKLGGDQPGTSTAVLDSLGEGVAVTDINDRLMIVNDTLTALIHSHDNPENLHGKAIQDLFQAVPGVGEGFERPLRGESLKPFVTDLTADVDGEHVLRCARRPHMNDKNEHVGFVWTVRDITQQRLAESTREQFVSMATHELRTPLANIRAYAETMAISEGIKVEQQKSFCNTILSEASRLSRFVDDLLDITRMQAGSLTLDRRESDLETLFDEASAKLRGQIQQKNIQFTTTAPDKLPKLNIDKEKILAAVLNLLGNAVKYTPENGSVRLIVAVEDSQLSIAVEDTGIGIEESELPRVFDKFFRSDDDRVREVSGSGLGLAFTLEVARLHGGDIEVKSELNKGTRFTMHIPIQREAVR